MIAIFTAVFLESHPFEDGNGRLSCIPTSLLLLRAGYAYGLSVHLQFLFALLAPLQPLPQQLAIDGLAIEVHPIVGVIFIARFFH